MNCNETFPRRAITSVWYRSEYREVVVGKHAQEFRNRRRRAIPADLGFAGFRLAYPFFRRDEFNHVIFFAGGAGPKGRCSGLSARGLAIDTGLPSGEEFSTFKEFGLEQTAPQTRETNLVALLDSPSVGAR
jgi:glucan biosynthesis protein